MSKIDFDVIFIDPVSSRYYDFHALEKQALGGTEATVVRVAEGLAGFGLKVAVVLTRPQYFEPMTSKHAFYFHLQDLPTLTCKHFIQLRSVEYSHLYRGSKKYVWLHDTADETLKNWNKIIHEHRLHIIGVSRFHKKDLQKYLTTSNIEYIYNPVPDEIYKPQDLELKYKPDLMVWAASPHKGLGKALETFRKIREKLPLMNLVIANPGYKQLDGAALNEIPGVSLMGPQNCRTLWSVMQQSLCVYYPSHYDETFGLILAEANALGVPMLGYNHGALKEVVSNTDQLVEDESALVERCIEWHSGKRPKVEGREEFKLSRIVMKWIQLLGGRW